MDKHDLKRAIDELDALPVLPGVAEQLLPLVSRKGASVRDTVQLVATDSGLTASILRLVEDIGPASLGSEFSLEQVVENIDETALKGVLLDCVMGAPSTHLPEYQRYWRHSLACALFAERLAAQVDGVDAQSAYLAGLLHDLGRLALYQVGGDAYAQVVRQAFREKRPLLSLERQAFGVDHALVGKWLAEKWRFPEVFVNVIWFHHHPLGILDGTQYPVRLIDVIATADAVCQTLPVGGEEDPLAGPVPDALLARLGLVSADLAPIRDRTAEALAGYAPLLRMDNGARPGGSRSLRQALGTVLHANARMDGHLGALRRANRSFRALHELNLRLIPGLALAEILSLCSEAMRDGLESEAGACIVSDPSGAFVYGKSWTSRDEEPEDLFVHLETGETAGMDVLPGPVRAVLDGLLPGEAHKRWEGASIREVSERDGVLLAPMVAGHWHAGLILIPAQRHTGVCHPEPAAVQGYANACAAALVRHRTEEHLRDQSEELATALTDKEETRQQTHRTEKMIGIGQMAAGAAHAINNPLTIITGQAQILLGRLTEAQDVRALTSIIQNTRRASAVLLDLLAFARPIAPKFEQCLINYVLHQIVTSIRERLSERGITVIEQYAEGLPRVMIDRHQIEQVFVRLLTNAEDALEPDGGRITVQTRAGAERRSVIICVADDGCGIAPEQMERLFEPFFTTQSRGDRSGLGLSVCHGVVTQHHGTIHVQSTKGRGTAVTVVLPRAPEESTWEMREEPLAEEPVAEIEAVATSPPPLAQSAPKPEVSRAEPAEAPAPAVSNGEGSPVILVVDDDEDLRNVIAETLRNRGYQVRLASDGYEALGVIASNRTDLVLLDMHMPRKDGLSVLADLSAKFLGLPIVVMSGFMSDDEAEEALRLGARSCLRKPFRIERLLAEIGSVFTTSQASSAGSI